MRLLIEPDTLNSNNAQPSTHAGHEIVVFSPARRASRKLLERVRTETEQPIAGTVPVIFCSVSVQIVEFVRLAGGDAKICEYVRAPTLSLFLSVR